MSEYTFFYLILAFFGLLYIILKEKKKKHFFFLLAFTFQTFMLKSVEALANTLSETKTTDVTLPECLLRLIRAVV